MQPKHSSLLYIKRIKIQDAANVFRQHLLGIAQKTYNSWDLYGVTEQFALSTACDDPIVYYVDN